MRFFASVTLILTRQPSYTNLTVSPDISPQTKNELSTLKLSTFHADRQTDRQMSPKTLPRRSAVGKKSTKFPQCKNLMGDKNGGHTTIQSAVAKNSMLHVNFAALYSAERYTYRLSMYRVYYRGIFHGTYRGAKSVVPPSTSRGTQLFLPIVLGT